jgi:hypothetical protein
MKRITFNVDDAIFEKLGDDKTVVNKAAKEILVNSFEEVPQVTPPKAESNHRLLNQIRGYLNDQDHVYLEVISNNHRRRSIRLQLGDL